MKRLILWDLDGTLIDTLEDLGAAVDHALKLRGLPVHTPAEYRRMVGHGVRNLVRQALEAALRKAGKTAQPDDAAVDAALADFKSYYTAHIDVFTRPYPGIPALLTELQGRGVRMAVASNKFQEGTEHLIREFFPDIAFVSILGNRPGFPLKPAPEIVEEVLAKAGVARADALLVGDSLTDMKTAANGGIESIAVAWGYRTPEELAGNRLAGSVSALRDMLLQE
ncbi:MAG: HAD family hydrolase [Bacteroidales bacterium]|nr:HAD family hydrolase [Bacteroidales bacterium]